MTLLLCVVMTWTNEPCRRQQPINARDAGYAPTLNPTSISAPNYHQTPTTLHTCRAFQRTCYRRVSRPALRWAVGYSRRSMILLLHTGSFYRWPDSKLMIEYGCSGEDMTRIATSDAPTLKLTRNINGPAGCLCFNLCSFFILIILLAYLLHVSHFNSCKDSQEPPRRVSYHGLALHASREG